MGKIDRKRHNERGVETNICFDCRKAVGLCSWSEVDQETNEIKFIPPEGAVYESVQYKLWGSRESQKTLYISECPLFEPDRGYTEQTRKGVVDRGQIVAAFDQGLSIRKVADKIGIAETAVRCWRDKLIKEGVLGAGRAT